MPSLSRNISANTSTDPITQVIGLGGVTYSQGDIITGAANLRALYLTNGLRKVTYETKTPDAERAATTLYGLIANGSWPRITSARYGDWSYFGIGITAVADRATVVEATDNVVEVDLQWDAFNLASFSGGGVLYRNDIDNNYVYPISSSTAKRITSTRLVKSIRLERGAPGYFVGWHSADTRVGPPNHLIALTNNESDWGEREVGTGGGTAVAASSAGVISRHPAWGADARWAAAEAAVGPVTNRIAWMGIDDNPSWTDPTLVALQAAGFPHEQVTGPFWVLDIPSDTTIPFCRYVCLRAPLETGVWQFGGTADGNLVVHFVNEMHSPAGMPYRHQVFIGATSYGADSSNGFANEPKASLITQIAANAAALTWPVY